MDPTPLVEKSKSGDSEAYGRLVERYQDYVFAICLAYLRQRELAEDATQEVFLAAFQSVRKLQEANRFRAWLKRMTINRCLDELRRRRKFLVSSIDELHETDVLQSAQPRTIEDNGTWSRNSGFIEAYSFWHRGRGKSLPGTTSTA